MAAAARILNSVGKLGLGVAVVGGVMSTALYNGELVVAGPLSLPIPRRDVWLLFRPN